MVFYRCIAIMVVVGACAVSEILARPQYATGNAGGATIINDVRDINGKGDYTFSFETSNGIYRQEQGSENNGMEQTGGWTYTSPEGVPIEMTFVANGRGFQPVGPSIPIAVQLPYSRTQVYRK